MFSRKSALMHENKGLGFRSGEKERAKSAQATEYAGVTLLLARFVRLLRRSSRVESVRCEGWGRFVMF
jgi:hypothetical protein